MENKRLGLVMGVVITTLLACSWRTGPDKHTELEKWPALSPGFAHDAALERKIDGLLAQMNLRDKVAQMIMGEIRSVTPEDVRHYRLGAVLNGGGSFPAQNKGATPAQWRELADAYRQASLDTSSGGVAIPILWGTDAVHGHNNVMGATLFPHNIALGATGNPALIGRIGEATRKEVLATGIHWVFAPTLSVVRDDRWGRTFEGFGEDPAWVATSAEAMVKGLQGAAPGAEFAQQVELIATAKHFIADGGTEGGKDRGDFRGSEAQLRQWHLPPYRAALNAGVQAVMVSFSQWQGKKMHAHRYLLTDLLKGRLGFDGLVVGDWNGHGNISGCSNVSCATAINAGIDMLMAPTGWRGLLENTVAQVKAGDITPTRIDDAVRRILRVKLRAGLFTTQPEANLAVVGSDQHRALAREAVRQSLVLLKNRRQLLPLSPRQRVQVAGDGADNIAKQSGGWSLTWQGNDNLNKDFPGATSIYEAIRKTVTAAGGTVEYNEQGAFEQAPDVAIVVFGEDPYAEFQGDLASLSYQAKSHRDVKLLRRLKDQGIPVASIFLSGRPRLVNKELNASDAFVAAWLPGSEGAGVSDVIFRRPDGAINYDFRGRLPFSWPGSETQASLSRDHEDYQPLLAAGYGLRYGEQDRLPERLVEMPLKTLNVGSEPLVLFERSAVAPWQLYVGDERNWRISVDKQRVATEGSDNLVVTETHQVRAGDARKVHWRGERPGQVYLQDNEPHDLSVFEQQEAVLSMDVNVEQAPVAAVYARMDCGYPCSGKVAIDPWLRQQAQWGWRRLSIDLRCFTRAGLDLSRVDTPFVLMTDGALTLSFNRVQLEPGQADKAELQCAE